MEEAFTEIYKKNKWGDGSGSGSNMTPDNKKYIETLEGIITDYKIKRVCDVGCGDWKFSQYVNWGKTSYLGIDCVKSVIDANKKNFKKKGIRFQHKALDADYIPEGYDLIILKDVIQHWEDEDILKFMQSVVDKNKYVFLTNGYKFMRSPEKNKLTKRNIQNPYRYHPVDIDKYPLNAIEMKVLQKTERRAKQMLLVESS
tara:strand:+ start:491 stop:1090 length:600 start_codon:yes stop_codon:yes gene_type:complete